MKQRKGAAGSMFKSRGRMLTARGIGQISSGLDLFPADIAHATILIGDLLIQINPVQISKS